MIKKISFIIIITFLVNSFPLDYSKATEADPVIKTLTKNISLDIKGMDILDVLKIIATQSGLNIVAGKNVTGRVTIFLKDVDVWDAFEIILASNDLAYEKKENIINVMTERDYELKYGEKFSAKKLIKVITLRYGKASEMNKALAQVKTAIGKVISDDTSNTVIIIDAPESTKLMENMVYQLDVPTVIDDYTFQNAKVSDLKDSFKDMLTPVVGIIKIDERANKIIIQDTPQNVDKIIKVAKSFDDESPQVFIEAQIIEVTLEDDYSLGIDWEATFNGMDINFTTPNPNFVTTPNIAAASAAASMVIGVLSAGKSYSIKATIRALEKYGKVRSLSNPRITVINNQEAKILVGSKEPYVTASSSTTNTTVQYAPTVSFVDLGTNLTLTPTINPDGIVKIKVKPEISSKSSADYTYTLNGAQVSVPRVTTTTAESVVSVKDGDTVILGGLIEDKKTESENKVPLLGDLPFVGNFFRSKGTYIKKRELVIFITPHIIRFSGDKNKIVNAGSNKESNNQYYVVLSKCISQKIKDIAGVNARGSVRLIFTLSKEGQLLTGPEAIIKNPDSTGQQNLREVAIAAVKIASPFPPFPKGMSKEKEEFNLLISFE